MLFPEFLFQLSARDQQVTWLDPLLTLVSFSALTVTVAASFVVPDGKALILTSACGEALPDVTQLVTRIGLTTLPPTAPAGSGRLFAGANFSAGAGIQGTVNFSGAMIIPPQWTIRATGIFNSGVAANTTLLHLHGVLIPIGNIQRV